MDKIWLQSPRGWINDPNGFCYYKGKYHLFYQHFPYAPVWGRMHWGHAVSDDLVTWEHLEIALYPSKTEDQDGCFSGSAIEDKEGNLVLTYTGVRYEDPNPDNTNVSKGRVPAAQLCVVSPDGFTFDNIKDKQVVLPVFSEDSQVANAYDVRDPKVFAVADGYRMVLGTTMKGKGRLLVYKSNDLKTWRLGGIIENDQYGTMWECPDLFDVDGKWFLIFSPMGLEKGCQAICVRVDFDSTSCQGSLADEFTYFDYGLDLYAPQSTLDEEGRRVVVAWLRMPRSADGKTVGMFCLPRVCTTKGDKLVFEPHPHARAAFSQRISSLCEANEGKARIVTTLREGQQIRIGGYKISRKDGCIVGDRSEVMQGCTTYAVSVTPPIKSEKAEIFVHPNLIEIYADGVVLSHTVYDLTQECEIPNAFEMHTI